MAKYIGVAKEKNDPWYMITLMLYDRMIKLTAYTKKHKKPKYYWYGKKSFDYIVNEVDLFHPKWFLGIRLG